MTKTTGVTSRITPARPSAVEEHDDDDYAVYRVEKRSGDAVWLSYGQSNKLKRLVQVRDGVEYVKPGGRDTRSLSASQPTWRPPGIGCVDKLWRRDSAAVA